MFRSSFERVSDTYEHTPELVLQDDHTSTSLVEGGPLRYLD